MLNLFIIGLSNLCIPPYCRNNLSINTTGQSFFLPFPVMRVMCGYCRQDTRQGSVLRFRHLRRIRTRVQPLHKALLPKEPESSVFLDIFIFFLLTLPGFSSVCSFIGNWESFLFSACVKTRNYQRLPPL